MTHNASHRPAPGGAAAGSPVIATVVRSGFPESSHRATLAALSPGGTVTMAAGPAGLAFFPRSASKPLQAAAMLRCGLDLDGELLALAAASHSGEDFHVAGATAILTGAGLDAGALQCPPDLPLDEPTRLAMLRAGQPAAPLCMNCSGKHAAMLATCVAAGWPTATYLDPGHPLQQAIRAEITALAGEPAAATGVDGCGAPLLAISVTGLARAMQALVLAAPATAERRVADAMRAHPEWTSGTDRYERALMAAVPGLLLKSGAEGVDAFALADGRAAVCKIEDGSRRASPAVTVALLRALGAEGEPGVDAAALARVAAVPVLGGGRAVGEITVTLPG